MIPDGLDVEQWKKAEAKNEERNKTRAELEIHLASVNFLYILEELQWPFRMDQALDFHLFLIYLV